MTIGITKMFDSIALLKEDIKLRMDFDDLLYVLNISMKDIIERFDDRIETNFDSIRSYLQNELGG